MFFIRYILKTKDVYLFLITNITDKLIKEKDRNVLIRNLKLCLYHYYNEYIILYKNELFHILLRKMLLNKLQNLFTHPNITIKIHPMDMINTDNANKTEFNIKEILQLFLDFFNCNKIFDIFKLIYIDKKIDEPNDELIDKYIIIRKRLETFTKILFKLYYLLNESKLNLYGIVYDKKTLITFTPSTDNPIYYIIQNNELVIYDSSKPRTIETLIPIAIFIPNVKY